MNIFNRHILDIEVLDILKMNSMDFTSVVIDGSKCYLHARNGNVNFHLAHKNGANTTNLLDIL